MDNKDLHFKGQQSNETMICFFRHHWICLIREISYFIIFLLIIIFTLSKIETIKEILRGERELKLLFITGFLLGTIYLHRFFIKMMNHFLNIRIITNLRIIDHQKTLFFRDTMDAIDMIQIQNIERIGEGLLPNVLKYGDIKIYLNASSAVHTLAYVPNDKFHFRCITRQKESLQQRLQTRTHTGLENARDSESPTTSVYGIIHEKKSEPASKNEKF